MRLRGPAVALGANRTRRDSGNDVNRMTRYLPPSRASLWAGISSDMRPRSFLRGKPYPVIGTLPFGVAHQVPGEIEDSLASEFVLPQVHAVPAKRKRRRWPVFDSLPSVKSHVQNERPLHFDQKIALGGQHIEGRVGAPVPSATWSAPWSAPSCRFVLQTLLHALQQFERARVK